MLGLERDPSASDIFTLEELLVDTGELRTAFLSLPSSNQSPRSSRDGNFAHVCKFAPEFDYVVAQLALPAGSHVLDVGADLTWSTARLASRGWRAVAIDINHHLPGAVHFRQAGAVFPGPIGRAPDRGTARIIGYWTVTTISFEAPLTPQTFVA